MHAVNAGMLELARVFTLYLNILLPEIWFCLVTLRRCNCVVVRAADYPLGHVQVVEYSIFFPKEPCIYRFGGPPIFYFLTEIIAAVW